MPGNVDQLDALAAARRRSGSRRSWRTAASTTFPKVDLDDAARRHAARGAARLAGRGACGIRSRRDRHRTGGRSGFAGSEGGTKRRGLSRVATGRIRMRGDPCGASISRRETGCALHVVHVSSGRGVALVVEARAARRRCRPRRRVRITWCLPTPTWSASARSRSARRRSATPGSARRCWLMCAPARSRRSAATIRPRPEMKTGCRLLPRLGRHRRHPAPAAAVARSRPRSALIARLTAEQVARRFRFAVRDASRRL